MDVNVDSFVKKVKFLEYYVGERQFHRDVGSLEDLKGKETGDADEKVKEESELVTR